MTRSFIKNRVKKVKYRKNERKNAKIQKSANTKYQKLDQKIERSQKVVKRWLKVVKWVKNGQKRIGVT